MYRNKSHLVKAMFYMYVQFKNIHNFPQISCTLNQHYLYQLCNKSGEFEEITLVYTVAKI